MRSFEDGVYMDGMDWVGAWDGAWDGAHLALRTIFGPFFEEL
jgi:hypothetical protein